MSTRREASVRMIWRKLIPELYNPNTIYLFDPARTASVTVAQVLPVPAFRIVAASSNVAHYDQTIKGPDVDQIYMTSLTIGEAILQGGELGVEASVVCDRYEVVGGVARHLFKERAFEDAVSRQRAIFRGSNWTTSGQAR